MKTIQFMLLGVAILLCTAPNAYALITESEKRGYISAPDGKQLVVELYHDDNGILPPPTGVQVRNEQGGVVARTPYHWFSTLYCPALDDCWALPYGMFLPIASPLKLDPEKANFSAMPELQNPDRTDQYVKRFHAYFTTGTDSLWNDPGVPLADFASQETLAFQAPATLTKQELKVIALSPWLIAKDHSNPLRLCFLFGLLLAFPVRVFARLFKDERWAEGSFQTLALSAAGVLALLFTQCLLLSVFINAPLLYSLGWFGVGVWGWYKILFKRRFEIRHSPA